MNTKHGYTGHEEDVDTGLVYAQARYYNPGVGRFYSQDPAYINANRQAIQIVDPQSWNSYSYARNNPIILVDPDGEFWGAVFSAGQNYLSKFGYAASNYFQKGYQQTSWKSPLTKSGYYLLSDAYHQQGVALDKNAPPKERTIAAISLTSNFIGGGESKFASTAVSKVDDVAKYATKLDDIIPKIRQTHILKGDATGGGHLFGANVGKAEFPKSWSAEKILNNAADIATDPNLKWVYQPRRKTYKVDGIRDDVRMTVIINKAKSSIVSAFPKIKNYRK